MATGFTVKATMVVAARPRYFCADESSFFSLFNPATARMGKEGGEAISSSPSARFNCCDKNASFATRLHFSPSSSVFLGRRSPLAHQLGIFLCQRGI